MRGVGLLVCVALIGLTGFSLQGQEKEKAPAARPVLVAPPGEAVPGGAVQTIVYKEPVTVSMKCATPGAAIRYTLDGSVPGPDGGKPYAEPIKIDRNTTFVAVAFKEGMTASPPAQATYLVGDGAKPGLHTLHVGNSLTGTTARFADQVRTTGQLHQYRSLTAGGALTRQLWDVELTKQKDRWDKALTDLGRIDHFTVQPRDFDVARETDYDIKFFNLVREKSPEVQPWFYCEWVEKDRKRPTDQGKVPSSQMKTLYPALTWEESMAAMLLYVEELQLEVGKTYKGGKRPRVIPSAVAMGRVHDLIEHGKFPGVAADGFYPFLFSDGVHPNQNGAFLVNCTWYAAFYRESPEGKMLPVGTTLTPEQATLMQRLAWDVVRNYPDCGLYEDGKAPAGKPEFAPAPAAIGKVTPVTLSSATPRAWFRYTLDGTEPTRTRGYLYCGVISVRPGMKVKAVAFKSGMAESPVVAVTYPSGD
jgi:hypothetical protein